MRDGHTAQCNVSNSFFFFLKEKKRIKRKGKSNGKQRRTNGRSEHEGEERERERERGKKKLFLSKIYGNRTVGFRWSKRQSQSTHQELRVGTKILEFRQTPRGRETWNISSLKAI